MPKSPWRIAIEAARTRESPQVEESQDKDSAGEKDSLKAAKANEDKAKAEYEKAKAERQRAEGESSNGNSGSSSSEFSGAGGSKLHKLTVGEENRAPSHPLHMQSKQELEAAIKSSEDTIMKITTPFQLLPISLTINRTKIFATKKVLFNSTGLASLPMDDVLNVTAELGVIFGMVKVDKKVLSKEDPYHFGPFWRNDALHFATIAQGYVMALKHEIDLSTLTTKELRKYLEQLGEDEGVSYK